LQLTNISISIRVANLVLYSVALLGFPDDGPLWIKICRNVQCDIIMYISEEQFCAFCWSNLLNCLLIMDNLKSRESKGKAVPLQAWRSPEGSRRLRLLVFMTNST